MSVQASIDLRTAAAYGLFAGNGVTNTGNTVVQGNVGVFPSSTVIGFPPGIVTGTIHINNPTDVNQDTGLIAAQEAQIDALSAYSEGIARETTQFTLLGEIGGLTLLPGVYDSTTVNPITINGNLTLDAGGIVDSVWIFKINTGVVTGALSRVVLVNGARPGNVYWLIADGLVSIGNNSLIQGTILSNSPVDISMTVGATTGAILSINGAITTNTNNISSFLNYAATGGDPHVLCLDGSRIDVYEAGFYRLFDNWDSVVTKEDSSVTKEDNRARVVINAEIRREPFDQIDYYHQIWIQVTSHKKDTTQTYLIEFNNGGLIVNNSANLHTKWTQLCALDDPWHQVYQFTCEAVQNTVLVATTHSGNQLMFYSGLLAGLIQPLEGLFDISHQLSKKIEAKYFDQNALVAGSHGPHIVTCHKTSFRPRHGWYRLLQWKTAERRGVINLKFDSEGQARHLIMLSHSGTQKDGITEQLIWEWIGNEHWRLEAKRNGNRVDRLCVDEQEIRLSPDSLILVRIQGNGSISASFRHLPACVRGLYFGDEIEVFGGYDEYLADPEKSIHMGSFKSKANQITTRPQSSAYQIFIEPDLHLDDSSVAKVDSSVTKVDSSVTKVDSSVT
jgi:hypothetical protein